ncbi:MAG TPA: hypothetical protein VGH97_02950 [Thermoanaerobaculia bacterium]
MTKPWSDAERRVLLALDAAVSSPGAAAALLPIGERVLATLRRAGPETIEAWEAVPLALYASPLPPEIKSSWVFVLRAGATTGAERHPNSVQRMMSWSGGGDFQVHDGARWKSHRLASDPRASLEERWLSIPPDTWHQGVVGAQDWLVVSFHTVPAEELIEERPDPADPDPFNPSRTRRRRYAEVAQS